MFLDRFEYAAAGPLDRTHLRWFTRGSAIALATGPGFKLEAVRTNPFPKRHRLLNFMTLGLFKRFIAQQWLVMARKPG